MRAQIQRHASEKRFFRATMLALAVASRTFMRGKFTAYYRVSTDKQGKSGLAAQRRAVLDYLDGGKWELVGEFTEVQSGKRSDRPELECAIAAGKKHRARPDSGRSAQDPRPLCRTQSTTRPANTR
jgi:hypothetical protein